MCCRGRRQGHEFFLRRIAVCDNRVGTGRRGTPLGCSVAGMVACQTLRLRCTLCSDAGVAQSAEQRFCKPQVGGSIPLASSMLPADIPTSSESFAPLFCPSHSVTVTVFVTILVFSRSKNSLSDRAARSRSASFTMLYLSNVARVLCPDIVIVIVSGTPALSMFLSPDLRRS